MRADAHRSCSAATSRVTSVAAAPVGVSVMAMTHHVLGTWVSSPRPDEPVDETTDDDAGGDAAWPTQAGRRDQYCDPLTLTVSRRERVRVRGS